MQATPGRSVKALRSAVMIVRFVAAAIGDDQVVRAALGPFAMHGREQSAMHLGHDCVVVLNRDRRCWRKA